MAEKIEVLFIDDEPFFSRRYLDKLEQNDFVVHPCERAEEALACLNGYPKIEGIVLDIMMPTPPGVSGGETEDGLNTGLWVLKEIKEVVVSKLLAVLIVTNRNLQTVEDELKKLNLPDWLVEVRRKIETPDFYLPDKLRAFIRTVQDQQNHLTRQAHEEVERNGSG